MPCWINLRTLTPEPSGCPFPLGSHPHEPACRAHCQSAALFQSTALPQPDEAFTGHLPSHLACLRDQAPRTQLRHESQMPSILVHGVMSNSTKDQVDVWRSPWSTKSVQMICQLMYVQTINAVSFSFHVLECIIHFDMCAFYQRKKTTLIVKLVRLNLCNPFCFESSAHFKKKTTLQNSYAHISLWSANWQKNKK